MTTCAARSTAWLPHRARASVLAASAAASAASMRISFHTPGGYARRSGVPLPPPRLRLFPDQILKLLLRQRRMILPVAVLRLLPAAPRMPLVHIIRPRPPPRAAVDHPLLLHIRLIPHRQVKRPVPRGPLDPVPVLPAPPSHRLPPSTSCT